MEFLTFERNTETAHSIGILSDNGSSGGWVRVLEVVRAILGNSYSAGSCRAQREHCGAILAGNAYRILAMCRTNKIPYDTP